MSTSPTLPNTENSLQLLEESYNRGQPLVPDDVYDAMVGDRDRLGSAPSRDPVRHDKPMLSLAKCTDIKSFVPWAAAMPEDAKLLVQPKVDGVASSLLYVGGVLKRACTRGDGLVGEDITEHAKRFVPVTIPEIAAQGRVELRGEVYMPVETFRSKYAADYANPRNLTAGTLNTTDPSERCDDLRFFLYGVLRGHSPVGSRGEIIEQVAAYSQLFDTDLAVIDLSDCPAAFAFAVATRNQMPFEADGVVFSVDDAGLFNALGATAHHPLGAIAWKFESASARAVFRNIRWTVGRNNELSPTALLEPTALDGVVIRKATLHNVNRVKQLNLAAGDTVFLERRGGVIPHVSGVAERTGSHPLALPKTCPQCLGPLEDRGDSLLCAGSDCGGRKTVVHFAATVGMDGFGPNIVESLDLQEPADLYTSDFYGLGGKTADNLRAQVAAKRQLPLATLAAAVSIPGLGRSKALSLARQYPELKDWTMENLLKIQGVGPGLAANVIDQMYRITDMLEHVTLVPPENIVGPLVNRVFVFTGELADMPRAVATKAVKELGAQVKETVTAQVTDLVVAASETTMTTKRKAAKAKGIPELSETQFLELLEQHT